MLDFVPFTSEWSMAVRAFNEHLIVAGLDPDLQFPEEPKAEFPVSPSSPLWQEFFLAVDGPVVRGAYFLTHEPWVFAGEQHSIANYRLPLSEGLVTPGFQGVAMALIRHALKRQPLIYCLGMSSYDRPLPRSLRAMKWPMVSSPFFFRSVRPARVMRNLVSLRSTPLRRLAVDLAAYSGAGVVGILLMQAKRMCRDKGVLHISLPDAFGSWVDEVWDRVHSAYFGLAVRTAEILRLRFARLEDRLIRVRFDDPHGPSAWALLLNTQMRAHRHFGDLRVGTIVDCLAAPERAREVVQHCSRILAERGADLIVANQSHGIWLDAFRNSGFLEGPSNRIYAASPGLAALTGPLEQRSTDLHLTRGDAAGPIHL